MHDDGYISKVALIVIILWIAVTVALTAAWVIVLFWPHSWLIGGMFAASACVLSGFTSAIHSRVYVARVIGVIRATSGLESQHGADVHPIN